MYSRFPTYRRVRKSRASSNYLEALQKQTAELLGGKQVHWPFHNCWFLSVPQLLVLLDDVNDCEAFRDAICAPSNPSKL
jgi:hypothetical protein